MSKAIFVDTFCCPATSLGIRRTFPAALALLGTTINIVGAADDCQCCVTIDTHTNCLGLVSAKFIKTPRKNLLTLDDPGFEEREEEEEEEEEHVST